jgi:hypothetical protein
MHGVPHILNYLVKRKTNGSGVLYIKHVFHFSLRRLFEIFFVQINI